MIGFRAQVQDGMQMMHPGKSDGFITANGKFGSPFVARAGRMFAGF
jgi:hypothetical protein